LKIKEHVKDNHLNDYGFEAEYFKENKGNIDCYTFLHDLKDKLSSKYEYQYDNTEGEDDKTEMDSLEIEKKTK
jgi:hypothetical protein